MSSFERCSLFGLSFSEFPLCKYILTFFFRDILHIIYLVNMKRDVLLNSGVFWSEVSLRTSKQKGSECAKT